VAYTSIKASAKGGKDFEQVPAGIHLAICTEIIHLGVQPSGNKLYPDKDQIYIRFEIPGVRVKWEKNGQPHEGSAMIGTFFTLSISEKSNFRPFLEGWRGRPFTKDEEEAFEVTSILGKLCQLSVIHEEGRDGKTRAKIQGAFGLIQEQKDKLTANPALGKATGPNGLVAYSPDSHDQGVWEKLPEWIQKKIDGRVKKATLAQRQAEDVNQAEDFNDDLPF